MCVRQKEEKSVYNGIITISCWTSLERRFENSLSCLSDVSRVNAEHISAIIAEKSGHGKYLMATGYWWKERKMLFLQNADIIQNRSAKLHFPKCPNSKYFVVSLTLTQQSHCGAEGQTVCVVLMLTFHRDNSSVTGIQRDQTGTKSLHHRLYNFLTQIHKELRKNITYTLFECKIVNVNVCIQKRIWRESSIKQYCKVSRVNLGWI